MNCLANDSAFATYAMAAIIEPCRILFGEFMPAFAMSFVAVRVASARILALTLRATSRARGARY
jgi:hypothetical protein